MSNQKRFKEFYLATLNFEGKASDHSWDPGGSTMYGLSATYNPLIADKIVDRSLTIDEAIDYVYNQYFLRYKLDQIKNEALAFIIFDSIFSGQSREIIRSIQNVANAMGIPQQVKLPMLSTDGVIGPKTIAVLNGVDTSDEEEAVVSVLKVRAQTHAKLIGSSIMKWQENRDIESVDVSNGILNRMNKRLAKATNFSEFTQYA